MATSTIKSWRMVGTIALLIGRSAAWAGDLAPETQVLDYMLRQGISVTRENYQRTAAMLGKVAVVPALATPAPETPVLDYMLRQGISVTRNSFTAISIKTTRVGQSTCYQARQVNLLLTDSTGQNSTRIRHETPYFCHTGCCCDLPRAC
jgi:hypothetical protein